jgi:hypothetical protein
MTAEGKFGEELEILEKRPIPTDADKERIALCKQEVENFKAMKEEGNQRLMVCSQKYNGLMKAIREQA